MCTPVLFIPVYSRRSRAARHVFARALFHMIGRSDVERRVSESETETQGRVRRNCAACCS